MSEFDTLKVVHASAQSKKGRRDRKSIPSVGGVSNTSSSTSNRRRDELWAELLPDYTELMEDSLVVQACKSTEDSLAAEGLDSISYSEFLHEYRDISDWLEQLLTTLQRRGTSRSEKYLNQSYHEELLSRSSRLTVLKDGGLQLIKRYPAIKDEVSERLETLQEQWNAAELAAAPGRLNHCPKVMLQDLQEDMVSLRDWLDQAERKLLPLAAEQSLDVQELDELLEQHKSLQAEVEVRSQFVSAVLRLSKQLQTDSRCGDEVERRELHEEAATLERRWQAIWLQTLERQYLLEGLLSAGGKVGVSRGAADVKTELRDARVGDSLSSIISSTDSLRSLDLPRRLDQLSGFVEVRQRGSADLRAWIKASCEATEEERSETLGSEYDTLPFPAWEYEKIIDSGSECGRLRGDGSDEGIDTNTEQMAEDDKRRREPGDGGYSSVSSGEEAGEKLLLRSAGSKQLGSTQRYGEEIVVQTQLVTTKTAVHKTAVHQEVSEVVREEVELETEELTGEVEQVAGADSGLKGIIDSLLVPDSSSSGEEQVDPDSTSSGEEQVDGQLKEMVDQTFDSEIVEQNVVETQQQLTISPKSGRRKQRRRRSKGKSAEQSVETISDVGHRDFISYVPSASDVCLIEGQKQLTDDSRRTTSLPMTLSKPERTLEVDIDVDLVFAGSQTDSLADTQGEMSEDQRSLAAFSENAWDNFQATPYSLEGCDELEPRLEWQPEDSLEPEDFESEFKRMQKRQLRQTQILDDSEAELEELAGVVAESGRQLRIVHKFLEIQRRDSRGLLDLINYNEVMASCETNINSLREIVEHFSSNSAEGLARVNRITELRSAWSSVQMSAQRQYEAALSLQQLTRELRALEQYADDQPPSTPAVDEQTLQTALLETQRCVTELTAHQQQLAPLTERLTSLSEALPDTDLTDPRQTIHAVDIKLDQQRSRLDDRLTMLQSRLASWREFRLLVSELRSNMQNDRHQLQDLSEQRQTMSSGDSSSAYSSADETETLRHDLTSLQKALSSHESRIASLTQLASSLTSHSSQLTQNSVQGEVTQIANEIVLLKKQINKLWDQLSEEDIQREKRRQLEVAEADLLDGSVAQAEPEAVLSTAPVPAVGSCWFRRLLLWLLPLLLLLTVAYIVYSARPCGFGALFAPSFRWVGGPPPT